MGFFSDLSMGFNPFTGLDCLAKAAFYGASAEVDLFKSKLPIVETPVFKKKEEDAKKPAKTEPKETKPDVEVKVNVIKKQKEKVNDTVVKEDNKSSNNKPEDSSYSMKRNELVEASVKVEPYNSPNNTETNDFTYSFKKGKIIDAVVETKVVKDTTESGDNVVKQIAVAVEQESNKDKNITKQVEVEKDGNNTTVNINFKLTPKELQTIDVKQLSKELYDKFYQNFQNINYVLVNNPDKLSEFVFNLVREIPDLNCIKDKSNADIDNIIGEIFNNNMIIDQISQAAVNNGIAYLNSIGIQTVPIKFFSEEERKARSTPIILDNGEFVPSEPIIPGETDSNADDKDETKMKLPVEETVEMKLPSEEAPELEPKSDEADQKPKATTNSKNTRSSRRKK